MEKVYSEDEEFIVTAKENINVSEVELEIIKLLHGHAMTLGMAKYVFSKILEKAESEYLM